MTPDLFDIPESVVHNGTSSSIEAARRVIKRDLTFDHIRILEYLKRHGGACRYRIAHDLGYSDDFTRPRIHELLGMSKQRPMKAQIRENGREDFLTHKNCSKVELI